MADSNKRRTTRNLPGRDCDALAGRPDSMPSGEIFDPVDVWNCLTRACCIDGKSVTFEDVIERARRQNRGIPHRHEDQEPQDVLLHREMVANSIKKLNEQLEQSRISRQRYTRELSKLHDGMTAEAGHMSVVRTHVEALNARRRKRTVIQRIVVSVSKKPWCALVVGGVLLGVLALISRKKIQNGLK